MKNNKSKKRKSKVYEFLGEFLRPTWLKIILLVILLIFSELGLLYFFGRYSIDCWGPDCPGILMIIVKINIFIIFPILIIFYLLFSFLGFMVQYVKNKIGK